MNLFKTKFKLLFLMSLLLFSSCSEKEVPANKIQKRNGIAYEVNNTNPFTGSVVEKYNSGQLKEKVHYVKGKLDGLKINWYKNGQKKFEANYDDGKEIGVSKYWHRDGTRFEFGKLKDIDGNLYTTIKIGKQIWMANNLNVEHFRNGDKIPEIKSKTEWVRTKKPAFCYYNNNHLYGKSYGKLYNWYAVNDPRGLAPEGWHIPSKHEWQILQAHVADNTKKLFDSFLTLETGFFAHTSGIRYSGDTGRPGEFWYLDQTLEFWSTTFLDKNLPHSIELVRSRYHNDFNFSTSYVSTGHSIRCLKD